MSGGQITSGKRGVIAALIDPHNRVIATAWDFTPGERSDQEKRAFGKLQSSTIKSCCQPLLARAVDQPARDAIINCLINNGCQTTLVLVGYDQVTD